MQNLPDIRAVQEYWLDAWQRSVLLLDVLRERGNTYLEQNAKEVPHVLTFKAELVRDGRTLERPVNYLLVRIIPPAGVKIDPAKAPIIVVDPRAGHGPGIGGMKQDSEIGVALAAGHDCYFVGFLPKPMPGQTIEDVCRAEAIFVEDVAARHPDAEGKPMIIANCQAGWQIMMMAATNPGPDRSDHAGRVAVVVLGRRAWQEPAALPGRRAGRHLAYRAVRRPGSWHLRRRQPGGQLRIAQSCQHLLEQGLQRLFEGGYRRRALP